ncbi:DUF2793 domain-containing protein [Paracoccus marcusii]|uniref:DUF2793 domain-containing protein n=1 Tax=Paracoccus marcusii TaxID=59779 RepID=UPI0039C88DB8
MRILDGLVQLSVLDRDLTAPPASPADGDRYLVASGASGDWAGWDLNIALWTDGAWQRLPPRTGWRTWVEDEALLLVWTGAAWEVVGEPSDISEAVFSLVNDADPTKKAVFSLSGISTGRPAATRCRTPRRNWRSSRARRPLPATRPSPAR